MDIFSEKSSFKKPVVPKKPAFNLPAGFFNKTWVFQALPHKQSIVEQQILIFSDR
jgi:hypothetical protein